MATSWTAERHDRMAETWEARLDMAERRGWGTERYKEKCRDYAAQHRRAAERMRIAEKQPVKGDDNG